MVLIVGAGATSSNSAALLRALNATGTAMLIAGRQMDAVDIAIQEFSAGMRELKAALRETRSLRMFKKRPRPCLGALPLPKRSAAVNRPAMNRAQPYGLPRSAGWVPSAFRLLPRGLLSHAQNLPHRQQPRSPLPAHARHCSSGNT